MNPIWQQHRLVNRLQSTLLMIALLAICALAGALLFGLPGLWGALGASLCALLLEPAAAYGLTLRLYRARPIAPDEAPELWALLDELARRAGLPSVPVPHYVPSATVNAFATGSPRRSAIALTDGLLRALEPRELAGVLAHEVAHIAHNDLRVMALADYISRLTSLLALVGQLLLLAALPLYLTGMAELNWSGLLLLIAAPHLALLAQLGLSRVREFAADLSAARLTADPTGLATALARIERLSRSWRSWLLPGWGNPQPSWLRTHPATEERIRRLLELSPSAEPPRYRTPIRFVARLPSVDRRPRWHPGGYWR